MRNSIFVSIIILAFSITTVYSADKYDNFDKNVNGLLGSHYTKFKDQEYFSGIALSIYKPNQPIRDYYIGNTGHEANSQKIDANALFEIGSISKSFTSAIILQLQKEKKLNLQETMRHRLPVYGKWSKATIETLLNMTSGLPNYSDAPIMNAEQYFHPNKQWTDKELIAFVYPNSAFVPPVKSGYFYSNTGYVLAGMIIENITKESMQLNMQKRLFRPAELKNTFYPIPSADKKVYARLIHGYGYNPYSNPELVGQSSQTSNISWAGAAGAVISNPTDVIKWVKALFVDDKILNSDQKQLLTRIVSTTTGKPIEVTSESDAHAFGLGIAQGFDKEIGSYWFYEGETEGFRALYIYVPATGIIVSLIFNSAVDNENDHSGELIKKIYHLTQDSLKSQTE
jgi:D-alanyl-D-alanine carboxypeptidase